MDLSALLKGRTSAGLSSQVPGGKTSSPKKAPVSNSAAGRPPPPVLGSVADEPESDVEEDPFAEFTVMDGLEDLDEMLTDKDGAGPHPNVSHGHEPSESLATGVAASVQPGFSDAIQSDEQLGSTDQATQRSPVKQADYSTQAAEGAVRGQPCPMLSDDALPGVEQCRQPVEQQVESICKSTSKGLHSTTHAMSADKPGSVVLEAAAASGSSPARSHSEPNHMPDCEAPLLQCRPAIKQIPQQLPQDTKCHDDEMISRDQMPTQAAVGTAAARLACASSASLPQAPQCQFAAKNAAADVSVPEQLSPIKPIDRCQPHESTGVDVAQASIRGVSSEFTMQGNAVNPGRQSEHNTSHDDHMDVTQDRSQQQAHVCLDSINDDSTMDSELKNSLAMTTPQGETYCLSATAADTGVGSPANTATQHTESVRNGDARPPKTQGHAGSPQPPLCQNNLSKAEPVGECAIAAGNGAEDQAKRGHRPVELEGQDRMDDSVTGIVDQQLQATDEDMNHGDPVQDPTQQLDESGRDVPVSTATSVDSRAALLSSFWDTMSTDHAPEGPDDGSDIGAPAVAGHCANGPSIDNSNHANAAHHGQVLPTMSAEVAEPAIKITLCSQDTNHSDILHSFGKSPTLSSTPHLDVPHRPETRPSLHLRMASLSPTLASSPGLRPGAPSAISDAAMTDVPASFALAQDGEQIMDTDPMPLTASGTEKASNTCNITVQKEQQQILAEQPIAAMPGLDRQVETADIETRKATRLEGACEQTLVVNATGTEPDAGTPERTSGLEVHSATEASEPAQSIAVCNSCMIRPGRDPMPLANASHSETYDALQSPLFSSHIKPPRPQPTAQGNSAYPLQESQRDLALPSPSDIPQGQPAVASCLPSTQTSPAVQASVQVHPEIAQGNSTVGQIEVSRPIAHAGGLGSTHTNTAVQKDSVPICAGSSQTNHEDTHASVLRPIHNTMDHTQVNCQVRNVTGVNQSSQSLTSDGQTEIIESMAGKRKLSEDSVPTAAAKERRVDLPTNSEAFTGKPPQSQASTLPREGNQQTAARENLLMQGVSAQPASACDSLPGTQEVQRTGVAQKHGSAIADSAPCTDGAAVAGSTLKKPGLMATSDSAANIPDYRKALAELSASLQEATINVDETTDQAAEVRVQSAVLNNRWASMLQPEMFGSPDKSLSECYQNLQSVAAACRDAMAIAVSHGWMEAGHLGSVPANIDSTLMDVTARPCGKPLQEQRAL